MQSLQIRLKNLARHFIVVGGTLLFICSAMGCADKNGNSSTASSTDTAAPANQSQGHGAISDDDLKKQVIIEVAKRTNFDIDDVVNYNAAVSPLASKNNKKTFSVVGSFEVKTDKASNVYEAASEQVAANRCAVGDQSSCSGQFHHTVFFKANATVFDRLDGTTGIDVDAQTSVDKSFDQIEKDKENDREVVAQHTASGSLNVFLTSYKFSRIGGVANCDVELEVVNNTSMDLSDIAALVDVDSGKEGYSGDFTINSLPKGAALNVKADFQMCPELSEVTGWNFSDPKGYEGPYHNATGPAYFTLNYDNWQTAIAKLKTEGGGENSTVSLGTQQHPDAGSASSPIVPPQLISDQTVPYPPQSIRMGHEGVCVLQLTVDQDGSVSDASLVTSSGFRELDNAAIKAARGMRFRPAYKEGKPEEVAIQKSFTFSLHKQTPNL